MKILEIPFELVQILAEARKRNHSNRNKKDSDDLETDFIWTNTPEGYLFWRAVDQANWDQARKICPDLFPVAPLEKTSESTVEEESVRLWPTEETTVTTTDKYAAFLNYVLLVRQISSVEDVINNIESLSLEFELVLTHRKNFL